MLRKKFLSLLLTMAMCVAIAIPAYATDPSLVQVEVECRADIIEFFNSPEYNPDLKYEFIYQAPNQFRMLCPECGYNAYSSVIDERYNLNDPASQGRQVTCPGFQSPFIDVVTEMLVYLWQECDVCGYRTDEIYQETIWYVFCSMEGMGQNTYIATDYKTLNRVGCEHEWKDFLDVGWTLGCDGP